jgi:hypothetical protein
MVKQVKKLIRIDLDQFKLHIYTDDKIEFTLHFDSPSRRFYLSVIALVVNEMKRLDRIASIPLEAHLEELALLNETIGSSAGSSKKEHLIPRIYKKWKDALPNLEEGPLFKVLGRKKEYGDGNGKIYRVSEEEKDRWANLFEYKGSEENVRLKFSVDNLGVNLHDVVITYGEDIELEDASAWDRFIEGLKRSKEDKAVALDEYPVPVERKTAVSDSRKPMWPKLILINLPLPYCRSKT